MFDNETFSRIHPYTRSTFIKRLKRLVHMRKNYCGDGDYDLNDAGVRLLDVAIAATVQDCEWVGAAGVAVEITRQLHV